MSSYRREVPTNNELEQTNGSKLNERPQPGDGFTDEELETLPAPSRWKPRGTYEKSDIDSLAPGPQCVEFTGRIVYLHQNRFQKPHPRKPKGYFKICVKDDTEGITLVTVWTPHISLTDPTSPVTTHGGLFTNIFPENDRTCHFETGDNEDDGVSYRTPLEYQGRQLAGLMTLENFVRGGHEVSGCKILVCVKSIGPRKKITFEKDSQRQQRFNVEAIVFDNTAQAVLSLWEEASASAASWKPSETVLLISRPGYKEDRRASNIVVNAQTWVEVDPAMQDADWLREYARKLVKRDHVNLAFPEDVFDVEAAVTSDVRILFTLADIDEFVQASPNDTYIGYFSVVILELNLAKLHQRNMLFSAECCGVPIFANAASAACKQCRQQVRLRLNPRLVGCLVDRTGALECGSLIWADAAWEQLLGVAPAERLVHETPKSLRDMEQRMLFLRVTLLMGWCAEVGKLAVCRVLNQG